MINNGEARGSNAVGKSHKPGHGEKDTVRGVRHSITNLIE